MIGQLAVSFCEREPGQPCVWLDLWAYPDGTYNLVIENFGGVGGEDIVLPCGLHQLAGVLNRKPLVSEGESGTVTIDRCGDFVCAHFDATSEKRAFSQCIPLQEYREAIESLEMNALGYLA